ncbi:hypothetical protein INR49_014656 [Caranx melampygus]|nr:hypothetical protein INR49_014656 [Caranx melampygus]
MKHLLPIFSQFVVQTVGKDLKRNRTTLSGPLVEVNVGLPQDDMGVTSANTLRQHRAETQPN